jgi:hypothetical protein
MKRYPNDSILVMSCTHAPYVHQDALKFLETIKEEYSPDRVVHLGDEVDNHAMNFYKSDPNLMSAGYELKAACKWLKKLEQLFPKMNLIQSNHGSMVHRRAIDAGIPQEFIRELGDVYGVGKGWKWSFDLTLRNEATREQFYFIHNRNNEAYKLAEGMNMSCVQGHWHSKKSIIYSPKPLVPVFGMQVGCLIDDKALAYAYNKLQTSRPSLGAGMILKGKPQVIEMKLKKNGRWDGRL